MLSYLTDKLLGYVCVRVSGSGIERFVNLCTASGKDMWGVEKIPSGIRVRVRVSDYRSLRPFAKRTGTKLHIESKHGFPFWRKRQKKRPGVTVGGILFLLLLIFLSQRIWQIEVHGADEATKQRILTRLEQEGITVGVSAKIPDTASLRQKIMSEASELSWLSLNIEGTVLQVDMTKTVAPPERIRNDRPCNVVAVRDGVIHEILPNVGSPLVKAGDAVVKGDVLISGVVEYADGCTVLRHADGKVTADTVYEKTVDIPLQYTFSGRTGERKTHRTLRFFGLSIPLYFTKINPPYETDSTQKNFTVSGVVLPMGLHTVNYYPTAKYTRRLTRKQAKTMAESRMKDELEALKKKGSILSVKQQGEFLKDRYHLQAEITVKENIGNTENLLLF